MLTTKALFGPWVGEFGYELFRWQGHLRALSEKCSESVVVCRAGHEVLYRDFASKIIPFDPKGTNQNGPLCDNALNFPVPESLNKHTHFLGTDRRFLNDAFVRPKYIRLGSGSKNGLRLFHIRKKCSDRDWPIENWVKLMSSVSNERVAFVGSREQSLCLDGFADMRGIPLEQLADIVSGAEYIVGPSSGVMHFATLCGCKQIVWSHKGNLNRYKCDWNPFGTPVEFLDAGGFSPSVEYIAGAINKCH